MNKWTSYDVIQDTSLLTAAPQSAKTLNNQALFIASDKYGTHLTRNIIYKPYIILVMAAAKHIIRTIKYIWTDWCINLSLGLMAKLIFICDSKRKL